MHGSNPWPRPVLSPAMHFDRVPPAQTWRPPTCSRKSSSGNGVQSAGLNELGKPCRHISRRFVPVSGLFCGLGPDDGHLLCSACSPPPFFSGRLWGTNANTAASPLQLMAQTDAGEWQWYGLSRIWCAVAIPASSKLCVAQELYHTPVLMTASVGASGGS